MPSVSFIPIEVSRQMRSREKPLWIARPMPGMFAFNEGWRSFLNGVVLMGLVAYWQYGAIKSGDTVSMLIGLPFAALALYFMSAPVQEYMRARRTIYVISNQRLIILNGLFRPSVESFSPSEIGSLQLDIGADGSGNIIFQEKRDWRGQGGHFLRKIGFKAIAGVREARDHIFELKGQIKGGADLGEGTRREVERYRGHEIEHLGDTYRVGEDSFADSANAKAHIDAIWARSGQ